MRVLLLALGVLALLFLLDGASAQAGVTVSDFAFTPAKVQIDEGKTVTWTFGSRSSHTVTPDGQQVDWCAATNKGTCSVAFPTAGTYTYHCAFHPGMTGTVEVVQAAQPPSAPATRAPPSSLDQPPVAQLQATVDGLRVLVDGSASSDPDGAIFSYAWAWGDGSPASSGPKAEHAYAAPGTYEVRLTVVDGGGQSAQATRLVTVAPPDLPPRADFILLLDGMGVSVDASLSSDPEGRPLTFRWDWGDGTPGATGASASHVYALPGVWSVTLTAMDAANLSTTVSRQVEIAAATPGEVPGDVVTPASVDAPASGNAPAPPTQVSFSEFAQPRVPGPGAAASVLVLGALALATRRAR